MALGLTLMAVSFIINCPAPLLILVVLYLAFFVAGNVAVDASCCPKFSILGLSFNEILDSHVNDKLIILLRVLKLFYLGFLLFKF